MPEPLDDEETRKWCEGCPLDEIKNMEKLDCEAYMERWPQWSRWEGEKCPARERAEWKEREDK